MSKDLIIIGLIAVIGILVGGVYSTWKTAKGLAMVLGVLAVLAAGAAIAWYVSA
ncbi:MAG: hypothetical protein M3548_00715 [Actinomycetota bacterium]|nr:hypothetical protein [Actinomycetota bacterium]